MTAMYADVTVHAAEDDMPVSGRKVGLLARLVEGWRAAGADRRACEAFAELDDVTLRDLGLDPDEAVRAHNRELFTPRAWTA